MIKSDCWVPRADYLSTTLFVNFQTGCRMTKYARWDREKRKENIDARKKKIWLFVYKIIVIFVESKRYDMDRHNDISINGLGGIPLIPLVTSGAKTVSATIWGTTTNIPHLRINAVSHPY